MARLNRTCATTAFFGHDVPLPDGRGRDASSSAPSPRCLAPHSATGQWLGENGHEWALEFTTEVGAGSKKLLTGIDLVSLDEAGKIKEFTVLARPPNAVALLKDEMMRRVPMRLAAMKAKKAMGLL